VQLHSSLERHTNQTRTGDGVFQFDPVNVLTGATIALLAGLVYTPLTRAFLSLGKFLDKLRPPRLLVHVEEFLLSARHRVWNVEIFHMGC